MKELQFFYSEDVIEKLNMIIKMSWELLQRKVQNGLVKINKEASLQLQYASILQEMITIFRFSDDERVKIVLEDSIRMEAERKQEIDIVIEFEQQGMVRKIAIEMKCYRARTAVGTSRGGMLVFTSGVYEDIESLEKYKSLDSSFVKTYFLAMTDFENFVHYYDDEKIPKYMNYNISDNFELNGPVDFIEDEKIHINGNYKFEWTEVGSDGDKYYFLLLE